MLVSAATGPLGSTVGQVARLSGARAVGLAGSDAKCRYAVEELGFDACINYKAGDLRVSIKQACPDGVDVYFDNAGGDVLAAALANLAMHARVIPRQRAASVLPVDARGEFRQDAGARCRMRC